MCGVDAMFGVVELKAGGRGAEQGQAVAGANRATSSTLPTTV